MTTYFKSINTSGSKLFSMDITNVANHSRVFVESVRDYFRLEKTSTLTVDGYSVVLPISGFGRWVRENTRDGYWPTQTTWYIDPISGGDENDGSTSVTALKTLAEFIRRVGNPYKPAASQVDITILNTTPVSDPLNLEIDISVIDSKVAFHGTPTIVSTNTFTAVVALNRTTNTRNTVTRSGAPWTANIGKLLKDTNTSPAKYAWITAEPVSGTARTTRWLQFDPTLDGFPTAVEAVNGDTYQIVSFPTISTGHFKVNGAAVTSSPLGTWIVFENLQIGLPNGAGQHVFSVESPVINILAFNNCIIGRSVFSGGAGSLLCNCYQMATLKSRGSSDLAMFGGTVALGATLLAEGGTAELDFDILIEGTLTLTEYQTQVAYIGAAGFFTSIANGLTVPSGVTVMNVTDVAGVSQIWGTGNPGYGIVVLAGGKLVYQKATPPNVNTGLGVGRETIIGGNEKLLTDLPYVESASGAGIVAR